MIIIFFRYYHSDFVFVLERRVVFVNEVEQDIKADRSIRIVVHLRVVRVYLVLMKRVIVL